MSNPLISIVIPCYNAELYIDDTINSVLAQTFSNFEVLIVNDGSTDNSLRFIEKYLKDSRLKIINKKNGGVSSARNLGFLSATGKYIALLDADDLLLKSNIQEKIEVLENNQEILFVYSDMIAMNVDKSEEIIKGYQCQDITNQYLMQENFPIPGICSNVIFRKSILEDKSLLFDENLSTAADQDFMIFLSRYGKGYYLNKALWIYRVLPTSMSRKIALIAKDHLYMIKKYEQHNFYTSKTHRRYCLSKTYLILAGCYWVEAKNKLRGLYYIFFALWYNPKSILILLKKI